MSEMSLTQALQQVLAHHDLSRADMQAVMRQIMTGEATPAQIGGFLIALRMKGETVDEITAAAEVMRELATPVQLGSQDYLIDTCGTGGDASGTFNISTASAFVIAAAGGRVAKHGNRSVSSKSGSADVLEAAGVRLDLTAAQVAQCVDEVGVGFMFAPAHHSAMKHAIGPRRELGVRTIFNLLGPLTNPAGAPNQVLGVFSNEWLVPLAHVLGQLGSRHVLVVHGEDGLDEISLSGPTEVAELKNGEVHRFHVRPSDFGISEAPLDALKVSNATESLETIRWVLAGEAGPASDIVAMNAGAALYASGMESDLAAGIERARAVLKSGAAAEKLSALTSLSQSFGSAENA